MLLVTLLALAASWCSVSGQERSSPHHRSEERASPLMFAARDNNVEAIKTLIAAGADVNAKNAQGSTPLMWAAAAGSTAAVRCLLRTGADVNAKAGHGKTALSLTIEYFSPNHIEQNKGAFVLVVRELLASGAKVDSKEDNGLTPLLWAAAAENADIARELIAAGAGVNGRSRVRITPGTRLAVTPLIYSVINCTDQKSGALETIKLLLEKGADVNATDGRGRTALQWAVERGELEIVAVLKEEGREFHAKRSVRCSSHGLRMRGFQPFWHAFSRRT
jgi:ankyrin repeat protein